MSFQTNDELNEPGLSTAEIAVSTLFKTTPSFSDEEKRHAVLFVNKCILPLQIDGKTYLVQAEEDYHSLDPQNKRVSRQYLRMVELPPELNMDQLIETVEEAVHASHFPDGTRYRRWEDVIKQYSEKDTIYKNGKGANGDIIFRMTTLSPLDEYSARVILDATSRILQSQQTPLKPLVQRSIADVYKSI